MKTAFRAAMFDMDGTLLCTMPYWRLTTLEFLLQRDILPTDEQLSRLFTTSSRKLCAEIMAEHGMEISMEEILKELEGYMHRHYLHDARPLPFVGEYLEKLKRAGVKMCVGTAAPRDFARDGLDRLKLSQYFEFITDCYAQKLTKGEPEFFHRMAGLMGVDVGEMCVFEDALYSIRAAKEAGCPVIARMDETQIHDWPEIRKLADKCIVSYRELI